MRLRRHAALARRDLVRPAGATSADAFRFSLLVRDAAYAGLLKRTRADLHERFAAWLERRPLGQEALIGHHLESAYRALVTSAATRRDAKSSRSRRRMARRRRLECTAPRRLRERRGAGETRARAGGPADPHRPELATRLAARPLASVAPMRQRLRFESEDAARRLGDFDAERRAELYVLQERVYTELRAGAS